MSNLFEIDKVGPISAQYRFKVISSVIGSERQCIFEMSLEVENSAKRRQIYVSELDTKGHSSLT